MEIYASKYAATTIPEMIKELEQDKEVMEYALSTGISGNTLEAIATHLVMTDTDYNTEAQNEN